eukprot:SAG22_NODE_16418_length_325_cov_1.353982_1_plen_20_part_01
MFIAAFEALASRSKFSRSYA